MRAGSRHHSRGSWQEKGHFLSSLVSVYIQDSCFSQAFSTDFDGLSAEAQANFTKAVGLPGTHSSVIRRFWHGCNYWSLDVAQERMRQGMNRAPATAPGIGGTLASQLGCPASLFHVPAATARGLLQGGVAQGASAPEQCCLAGSIVPTWSCLGSSATMPLCAGKTLNKDGPCPKDPAI